MWVSGVGKEVCGTVGECLRGWRVGWGAEGF